MSKVSVKVMMNGKSFSAEGTGKKKVMGALADFSQFLNEQIAEQIQECLAPQSAKKGITQRRGGAKKPRRTKS